MSYKVVRRVLERSSQRRSARMVLLVIAEHANHQGLAFPGIRKISREAKLHERTAQLLIRKLEKSGELRTLKGQGRHGTNLYQVLIGQVDSIIGVTPRPGVASDVCRGGIQVQRGVAPVPPKPSEEIVKEPSEFHLSNDSDRDEPFDPSEILGQMRQRLGKKMTMPGTKICRSG